MSSTYKILCLSHDPALVIPGPDWNRPEPAIVAACARAAHDWLVDDHATCDLLVGCYSYPLVKVCCPPQGVGGERQHQGLYHPHSPQWADRDQLVLLYRALTAQPGPKLSSATEPFVNGCWTWERLVRLAPHLGIEVPEDPATDDPEVAAG